MKSLILCLIRKRPLVFPYTEKTNGLIISRKFLLHHRNPLIQKCRYNTENNDAHHHQIQFKEAAAHSGANMLPPLPIPHPQPLFRFLKSGYSFTTLQ